MKWNLMRSFNKWLKFRIRMLNIGKMMVQHIIGLEVIRNREGKWI